MSRNHQQIDKLGGAIAVRKAVATSLSVRDAVRVPEMNHFVERTGEAVILLSGYLSYRLERMSENIESGSPFVNKLRNRTVTIIRACDEFAKVMEPYIEGEEKRKAYGYFSDAIYAALDSFFDDMHRDEPEATMQVRRRAKLRYHDPYSNDVKERTGAFEDGFVKGYTDAMDDFMRELANLSEAEDQKLVVDITDGKVKINKLNP